MIATLYSGKIAVTGVPKSGKTTLCRGFSNVLHTDIYRDNPWEDIPGLILDELSQRKTWVVEGIQVARALRKGLRPDVVIYMPHPRERLTNAQSGLSKAVCKWFGDWLQTRPNCVLITLRT